MAGRFFCEKPPVFCAHRCGNSLFVAPFHLFSALFRFPHSPVSTSLASVLSLLSFLPQSLNLFLTFSTRFSTVFRILFSPLHFFTKNIAAFPRVYFRFFPFILRIFIDFNKSTAPTTITILLILSFLPFPSLEGMVCKSNC